MKTRLAGTALVILAVGPLLLMQGCGSSADRKIALQIEPNLAAPQPDHADAREPLAEQLPQAEVSRPAVAGLAVAGPAIAPDPAGVLARKTEEYAKSIQLAMAQREKPKPTPGKAPLTKSPAPDAPAAQLPAAAETPAQWMHPDEFKIGAVDDAKKLNAEPAPLVKPADPPAGIVASAPQANQGAALDVASAPAELVNSLPPMASEPIASKASAVMSPMDMFESRISKRFKDYPRDVSANLDYQMLMFLHDEPVPQLSALTTLPTEDRELISAVMDGLSNFRSTLRSDNNMLLSRKIRPITELSDRLRRQAELSIPTLALCTKVEGFGRYDPIDPPRLIPNRQMQAIIYCELENFTSQLNTAKLWQTDVSQEAMLYTDDASTQVWADKTRPIQDTARRKRHDFFLRTLVTFPNTLSLGRYILKVTIVDQQANRVAEASLPIQIVAQ